MAEFDTQPWSDFMSGFRWRQGQHVAVIKPTGGGKTTLVGSLLSNRPPSPAIVVMVTKIYDRTFARQFPTSQGWHRVEAWPPPRYKDRILLWPRFKRGTPIPQILAMQRMIFTHALDNIFGELGWTVAFDEEHYMCEFLGMRERVAMFHFQGRSSGFTCIDGVQRPVSVPRVTFSGAHHAFVGNTTDRDDLKRLTDLAGPWGPALKAEAPTLDEYEFIHVPARVKGRVPVRLTVDLTTKAA
jgi:hypothetical protein